MSEGPSFETEAIAGASAGGILILAGGAYALYRWLQSKTNAGIASGGVGEVVASAAYIDKNPPSSVPELANSYVLSGASIIAPTAAGNLSAALGNSSVVNDHSQGFYNAALMEYSYNQDDTSAWDSGQGTNNWPWKTYDQWVSASYPQLPTAGAVSVDKNGVYHNSYI